MAGERVTTDRRVRALWTDWCAATGADPALPPAPGLLDAFFTAVPVADSTRRRRAHALGVHAEPAPPQPVPIRTGEGWADPGRALAQARTWGFPAGLRGRRDAWLILLTLMLRIPARQALTVAPVDVVDDDGRMSVCGVPIPVDADPRSCPACAATRWLRIAAPAGYGWRGDVQDLLTPAAPGVHDHTAPLPAGWRDAWCLAPSVDRWGWVRTRPLTPVGLAVTLRERQRERDIPELPARPTLAVVFTGPHPPDPEAARALTDGYDDLDDRIDRITARLERLLEDAADFDGHLRGLLG